MDTGQAARPLRRLAAFALDYVAIAGWIVLISVGFALLPRDGVARLFASPASGQATAFAILTLPVLLYFALFEAGPWQATPGKRALGLRVTDRDGKRVRPLRSLARTTLKLLPWELAHTCLWRIEGWPAPTAPPSGLTLAGLVLVWILVAAWLVPMLVGPTRRSLYDHLAGTSIRRGPGES